MIQRSNKKGLILLIPPVADPTMPMLGPYVLAGSLKQSNIPVQVYDISIAFFKNALDTDCIRQCGSLSGTSADTIDSCLKMIQENMMIFDDKLRDMILAAQILTNIQKKIRFSTDDIQFPYSINSADQLKQAVVDLEWVSPLFMRQPFWQSISEDFIRYIGLSISYTSQLPSAFFIANLIRKFYPNKQIILGGAYFESYEISPVILLNNFLFIDKIIVGTGEKLLFDIIKDDNHDRRILYSDNSKYNFLPDFSGVQWDDYCAEKEMRVIPFSFRTRCYYGKCTFCSGDSQMPPYTFTQKRIQDIIRSLKQQCGEYGITHVYFTDAALPPVLLMTIAEEIAGKFCWGINARIEKDMTSEFFKKLFANGCRMLRIGMESASQTVLDRMNKGHHVEDYSAFLASAYSAGIKLHVYIMYGFPGEEESDRELTLVFLKKHLSKIYSYTISIFHAIPGTKIYNELIEAYHLESENLEMDINHYYYTEKKHQGLLQWVSRTDTVLDSLHSNRFCYGGRVFMGKPSLEQNSINKTVLQNCNYVSDKE
ncbi:hypothetical protein AGMMS50268_07070 [Spirochaetia bacterium]|nr:hypothetical protein AGMMS50268_07070 [Spirochaetia bacterium]